LKNQKLENPDPNFGCFLPHNDPILSSPKSMFWGGTFSTIFPKNIRGFGSDIFGAKKPDFSGFSPKMVPGKIFGGKFLDPFFWDQNPEKKLSRDPILVEIHEKHEKSLAVFGLCFEKPKIRKS
jgi:hypothetical protein